MDDQSEWLALEYRRWSKLPKSRREPWPDFFATVATRGLAFLHYGKPDAAERFAAAKAKAARDATDWLATNPAK
jgi:hypothetical protein